MRANKMLDLVIITCFVIVVGLIWIFSNITKTAKSLRNDLNGIGSVLINISEDIDNLYKQLERSRVELENKR
jgi:hypothetical protein